MRIAVLRAWYDFGVIQKGKSIVASATSGVYIIAENGSSTPMKRVRCMNEDTELQRILEKNHDLLPGDQIDPKEPRRWLLIKREMPVSDPGTAADRFSLDFLFADQDAIPTLVECKRFADMRSRREIVGQMIEYAANGPYYWRKDSLRGYAEEAAKHDGCSLDEALQNLQGPDFDSPDVFFDSFVNNLRVGKLRIVFFLDESPMELRSVIDFLSKQMEPTEVLLVEARQYRLNGTLIVTPKLFGYTEEARKEMRSITAQVKAGRRQWDELSFFADAQGRLGEQVAPLRALYDQLNTEGFGLEWGSGQKTGTFNVRVYSISPRALITVYSTGSLQVSLIGLPEPIQEELKSLVAERLALNVSPEQKYPSYSIAEWENKVDVLVKGLVSIVEQSRALAESTAS